MVVLDRRIVARRYGSLFIESLPPVQVEVDPLDDLLPLVRRYVS